MPREKNFTIKEVGQMWEEYKAAIDNNPDIIESATNKGIQEEKRGRPYLQSGFYAFVYNKTTHHIHHYFENLGGAYDKYLGIVTHVRNEWRSDHISGTMTGKYKAPNLTARINGLSDNQKVEHTSPPPLFPDVPTDDSNK